MSYDFNEWSYANRAAINVGKDFAKKMNRPWGSIPHIEHLAFGLAGEVGEICDEIKKAQVRNSDLEIIIEKIKPELADVFIYLVELADACSVRLPDEVNDKLRIVKERLAYGDGTSGKSK